jgi:uncharacterized protein YprB with RNaseH-like and TPR domain
MARILFFDIETTHLKADFGTMIAFGYKWADEDEAHVLAITDYRGYTKDLTDDSKLVAAAAKLLTSADIWVSYFGKGFDVKFINAKMLEHGLPVLPNTPHVDLFYTVKSNLALSRKSLANVSEFLQFENSKTPVTGRMWRKAMVGNKEAIQYVVDHCKSDVLILEEAYLKLRPLVRLHPRVEGWLPCRVCGSTKLQRRGNVVTVTKGKKYRVRCNNCGAWEQRSETHEDQSVVKYGERIVTQT